MSRKQRKSFDEEVEELLEETAAPAQKAARVYRLRSRWHGRLIVEAGVPSGKRYEFNPGDVKEIDPADYQFLLSKQKEQGHGCCGGAGPSVIKYFEEA